ncbi:MAG: hypothetical protein E6R14_02780 [Thermomicrobiales bacterium]|nr:MAG: hypothetical protein E6R14_02780 [Thermomicrobiales bacterium]
MTSSLPIADIDPRYALDPADRNATFVRDQMHFPFPVCPLFQSVHPAVFPVGYLAAAREIDLPIADFQFRFRNNYEYDRVVPVIPQSADEAQIQAQRAEAAIQRELARMSTRWYEEHLPRLRQLLTELAEFRELDPAAPLDPTEVDFLIDRFVEAWTIHFRIAFPMLVGIQLFEEFVSDVVGPDADAHAMLVGVYSESVAKGIGITDLAASARALGLGSLVLETPSDQLEARLRESRNGQELLRQIETYLATYGLTQGLFDFADPTWLEDPAPLYATMRAYLETGGDNRAAHEAQIRRADAAIAEMRQYLAAYPEPVRGQFEALLVMARDGSFLQEEHNFYIDQQFFSSFRLAILALGRQLAWHGRLDQEEDILFLHLDEIRAMLSGDDLDARGIVAERRASYEASKLDVPPPFLGQPPSGPPPNNPLMRAMGRFFGWAPPTTDEPGAVRGYAASRGQVTAPAFVARSLEAASAIPAGHVLVTVTTTPSWTPLFGIASAIITETGGPLSHCAIVAREYGLPAIVGVRGATTRIQTGQLIRVDGTTGEGMLLS